MPCRPLSAALVASLLLVGGATACGSAGGGPTGPVAAPPPRVGAVDIDPGSGPVGTLFTLTADGLREGEVVAFEITFPGEGKAYPGAPFAVPTDGIATTTYRATTANQPGEYVVRLTGPPGNLAEGRFRITDGPPVTSTLPDDGESTISAPTTSGRTGTTRSGRSATTAAAGAGATTTTTRASGITTTTRRTSTTLSTGTSKPGTTTTVRR